MEHEVIDTGTGEVMSASRALNPFGGATTNSTDNAMIAASQSREIADAQAAVAMARHFPRDGRKAVDRILTDCTRPALANVAMYAYKRGSEIVSGPSIRLAESIARAWGNLDFGVRELSQENGVSTVEAFCWDLETNTKARKVFQVKHERGTKQGVKKLTDARDVYELVANMGARRQRACILALIPGDVVEAAVKQCELTQTHQNGAPEEQIATMVEKFATVGVTREMLVKRLGHKVEACKGGEIMNLRRIFTSINDGISKVSEFFEVDETVTPAAAADMSAKLRARGVQVAAAEAGQGAEPAQGGEA